MKNTNQLNYWKQILNQSVKNIFKNQQPAQNQSRRVAIKTKKLQLHERKIHKRRTSIDIERSAVLNFYPYE